MRLNPCISVYTIVYHIGVVLIARRNRVPDAPSYFSTTIFSAYLLSVIWLVAFILTIAVLVSTNVMYQVVWLRAQGLPVTVHSQRVQVVLTLYEVVMVGGMALKGHSIVESEGPDPPDWRNTGGGKVRTM